MDETDHKPKEVQSSPEYSVEKESVRRWLFDVGKSFEKFCRLTREVSSSRYHVYEIRIVEKSGSQSGHLFILKAFGESGGVIAFHQDNSVLAGIINIAERLENGKIPFIEDQYPPKDYKARELTYGKQLGYAVEKRITASEA